MTHRSDHTYSLKRPINFIAAGDLSVKCKLETVPNGHHTMAVFMQIILSKAPRPAKLMIKRERERKTNPTARSAAKRGTPRRSISGQTSV
jgi:hypothetical protein